MKIRFREIVITFVIGLILFFYWQKEEPSVETEQEINEVTDEVSEEVVNEPVQLSNPDNNKKGRSLKLSQPKISQSPRAKYPNLDDSFVGFDKDGNRFISQIIQVGKHLIYHGDVLLGKSRDLNKIMKNKVVKQARARKWTHGKIPYVIDERVSQYEKVMEAIEYLNIYTNLKIVPRKEEANYVYITLGESDCYSYAGMIGGMQEIFLTPNCGVRELLHEFMHTIGFFHEQNREDRDKYIKVVWENIDEVNKTQFKKIPNDFIGLVNRPFDFKSIMIYSSYTFSIDPNEPAMLTIDGDLLPQRQSLLSEEDINRVNLAYPPI